MEMMMDKQQQQQLAVRQRQCDMEVMKMAMLKHEETFRQQVHELHRLYRIQRQLMMSDLGSRGGQATGTRRRNKQPRRSLNLQLPADEYIVSTDEEDDGAELELTLALGGGASARRPRSNKRAEHSNSSGGSPDCSGVSLLSSSQPSSVEYYSDDGPAAAAVHHALPPTPPPCQRAVAFDLGEGMTMRQQQAPWLMQCHQYLSLRMT